MQDPEICKDSAGFRAFAYMRILLYAGFSISVKVFLAFCKEKFEAAGSKIRIDFLLPKSLADDTPTFIAGQESGGAGDGGGGQFRYANLQAHSISSNMTWCTSFHLFITSGNQ
jgi:hypothetical protein